MDVRETNRYNRHSIRLKGYDYSQPGAYFITICTQNREYVFGTILVGAGPCACPEIILNDAGRMISQVWSQIPQYYPGIDIDKFVVMPNHIHGIIIIKASPNGQPQGVAPTGLSLPDMVHRFKTLTTKQYTDGVKQSGWQRYCGKLWQRNYYEHVIRSEKELNLVREYILYNPDQWKFDYENPNHIDDSRYLEKWQWLEEGKRK